MSIRGNIGINRTKTVKPSGDGEKEVTLPPEVQNNDELTEKENIGLNQNKNQIEQEIPWSQQNGNEAESQKQAQGLIFKALAEGNLEDRKEVYI